MGSNRIFPVNENNGKSVAIEMDRTKTQGIELSQRSLNSPVGQLEIRYHSFADALIKETGYRNNQTCLLNAL
jgi:hypothetical protein